MRAHTIVLNVAKVGSEVCTYFIDYFPYCAFQYIVLLLITLHLYDSDPLYPEKKTTIV